jgi:PEP-CTERM motif
MFLPQERHSDQIRTCRSQGIAEWLLQNPIMTEETEDWAEATFSGTTSFSVPNVYTATCPTNATNQCFIPSILLPVTLGSTIPFTFTTSNTGSTTAGVVPEGSSLLLDARFNLQLFEADRVTPAAITSASPIPEPSTYGLLMLAGGVLSGLAYRNKRRA